MTLPLCTICASPEVIAIAPGAERLACVGITYARPKPDVAWCAEHWWRRFGADLFSMPERTNV